MEKDFRIYLIQKGRSYRPEGLVQMGAEDLHDMSCMCNIGPKEMAEARETVRVFMPRDC